ncbi:unnamed protein product [Closterium sp. NIES-64]|nr:unnamed protein product [Closterium sp. NIES-64]
MVKPCSGPSRHCHSAALSLPFPPPLTPHKLSLRCRLSPPPTPHFVVSSPRSSHYPPLHSHAISPLSSPSHAPFLCHLLSTPPSHCAIPSTPAPHHSPHCPSSIPSQGTARHRPATNAPFIFNIKTVGGMILLKVKFTDCFVEIAKLVQQWEGKEWVVLSVGPSGKPSPWEGNCSDAIPATLISGQALIGVSAALIGVSGALIVVSVAKVLE